MAKAKEGKYDLLDLVFGIYDIGIMTAWFICFSVVPKELSNLSFVLVLHL